MTQTSTAQHYGVGPRKVGGRYLSGYEQKPYTVTHVGIGDESRISSTSWSITVKFDDERHERTHATAWNDEGPAYRRDKIITE